MRRGSGGAGGSPGAQHPLPPPAPPARPLSAGPARMGWPGGSPCCCPAPPRPRPAGRPPQVSGRAARGGRAAACASRPRSSAGGGRQGAWGRRGSRGSGAGTGLGVGDRRSGGPRQAGTAGCWEGDQGAGRRPWSHSSWGRHAFARPGAHTLRRHGAAPSRHAPARAPHRTPLLEYRGARSPTRRPCSGREQAAAREHWPGSAPESFPFLLNIWGN